MKNFYLYAAAAVTLCAGSMAAWALTPPSDSPLRKSGPVNRFQRVDTRVARGMTPASVLSTRANTTVSSSGSGPMRVTAGGTELYGYLTAGHGGNDHGLYRFDAQGFSKVWKDPLFSMDHSYGQLNTAWVRNGRLCGFEHWFEYGYFWGQEYYELDLKTGELVTDETDEDCIEVGWFINACYDSDTDTVYGYGTDDEEEAATALFMKTSGTNKFDYQVIKDYGDNATDFRRQCLSMCYNPIDKNIYGINMMSQFVRIDKQTGDQTVLFTIDKDLAMYVTGLAYSPSEDLYYWNYNYDKRGGDWGSDLYTIDAKTGTLTFIDTYEGGDAFSMMFVDNKSVTSDSPRRPELKSVDFEPGATAGSITYTMPSATTDGTALSGELDWKFTVDGVQYANGKAAPGAEVTVPVTKVTSAMHTFGMSAIYNGHASAEITVKLYVGKDRPKSPESVILDEKKLRWSPVTEGVNGGYLNTENMTYEVYLNNELQGTTKRTSYDINIPADAPYQKWQAYVVAVCDEMRSTPANSNEIKAGAAWQLPVRIDCTPEMLDMMTIVNANGDDETWYYSDWDYGWYSGQVDEAPEGDDWIFLPPVNIPDASKYYSFYIECKKKANIYPNTYLEVYYGDYPDPAMMKGNVIMPKFSPQPRDFKEYGNPMFQVPEAGTYYIGIRCTTAVEEIGCVVKSIRIEDNSITPESPAAPTDIVATPGENGALQATVTFTMPTKTTGGQDIAAGTQLSAAVTAENTVTVTGTPGQEVSATVNTVQGDNTISVVVSNGNAKGERAVVNVYTGVAVPGSVKNLTGVVSPDMMSVAMTWEAPDAEKTGGYVDPATVEYNFAIKDPETGRWIETPVGTGVTSGTFNMPQGWTQNIYSLGVTTQNAAGSNDKVMAFNVQLGPAHILHPDMKEDFENGEFEYQPWVDYTSRDSKVGWGMYMLKDIATEWEGLETIALVGYGEQNKTDEGILGLPRFSTEGHSKVTVKVEYFAGDQASNLKVLGALYGMETPETLHECTLSDQDNVWKTAEIDLPASMLGQKWVQIYLDALFSVNHNYCIIESIEVIGDNSGVLMTMDGRGSVAGGIGQIIVNGYEGENFAVYTLGGVKVVECTLDGSSNAFALDGGIYMVTVGGKTSKVVVR